MLFACFAWIMHITPLLTPLWDDNLHLGHSIQIEVVSAAAQYERIKSDIDHSNHHLPDDSAARHWHHHTAHNAAPSADDADITVDASQLPKASYDRDKIARSDPDTAPTITCDLCAGTSAALVPVAFTHTDSVLVELPTVSATYISYLRNTSHPSNFLRPLTRAPPQVTFT